MGFNTSVGVGNTNVLSLTCASETRTELFQPETEEFTFLVDTLSLPFNISATNTVFSNMMHSAQHTSVVTGGTGQHSASNIDLSEVLLTYGLFRVDYEGVNTLELVFENPHGESAIVSVDAEKVTFEGGREDLIALSNARLFYIDDQFSNSPAQIDTITSSPCILDQTIKINATINLDVLASDSDLDSISMRVIPYFGSTNEFTIPSTNDDGFTNNVSSGSTFSFQFTANKTIGTGSIRFQVRDTEDKTIVNEDRIFTVGNAGQELGDSTCSDITVVVPTVTPSTNITATNIQGNAIINIVGNLDEATGAGFGTLG